MNRLPPTEAVDPATRGLDALSAQALVERLVAAHARAAAAVEAASPALARAAQTIADALREGGRLHYAGAGTSGRLGALDAAECPPTFGISAESVVAHLAGGSAALQRAVEGAEDDAQAGEAEAAATVGERDVVVALSAGGTARWVVGFAHAARARGARTIALTADGASPLAAACDQRILLETGAEPLAGSTRLVAGTAQKIALGTLSTAVMVLLGKVYDNLMVDVVATNDKLRARAARLVAALVPCDGARAEALLAQAQGSVKVAVTMARRRLRAPEARKLLDESGGRLRPFLE